MFDGFETIEPETLRQRVEAESLPPTMGALLDWTVERFGDREALNFFDDGTSVTWREYRAMVDRAANALRARGIGKGAHVALLMPNCIEFPVIWLALGKLGAVLVPVNIGYTARELRYVLEDSEVEHLVVHGDLVPGYEALEARPVPSARIITIGAPAKGYPHHWPALFAAADAVFAPRERIEPDDLLNIQYTSGTTGFPKGCMLSHRYWVTIGKACAECMGATMERVYGGYNFFYMICQRMLAHCLFHGSSLYVPNKPAIRRFMPDMRAHSCDYTTVFESSVYKQPPVPEDSRNALKLVNTFGLNKAYQADFQARFDVPAQEWYGMTEVGLVLYTPIHHVRALLGTGTCGVEAPFARLTIADEHGKTVKQGESGELCVKGPAILHGYYNKKDANAESFRDGWFRTGDQFRQDARGNFYIVGRFKDMIRRSGENIAAREVEAVLRTLPEVQDAAVVPVPDDYRGEEVKAYLMLMPGLSKDRLPPARVLEHCAAHLAPFKVPRYIEYRDALPRTESGRVQKKVLVAEKADLRAGSYDRQDSVWR
jgi:acyl-CoA synthetase (AMP-forming)/AMP-acid ligase II